MYRFIREFLFSFYNGLSISHHHYDYNPLQHTIISPPPLGLLHPYGFFLFFSVEHSHTQTFYYYVLSTLVCPLLLHRLFEWTEIRYLLISLGPEIYNKFLSKLRHLCGKPTLKSYSFFCSVIYIYIHTLVKSVFFFAEKKRDMYIYYNNENTSDVFFCAFGNLFYLYIYIKYSMVGWARKLPFYV